MDDLIFLLSLVMICGLVLAGAVWSISANNRQIEHENHQRCAAIARQAGTSQYRVDNDSNICYITKDNKLTAIGVN